MKTTSSIRAGHLLCALFSIGLLFAGVLPATDYTWTGNVSGDWNAGANWSSNPATPASSVDTNLLFGPAGSGGTTLNDNLVSPFLLNSIIANSNAPFYTIGGNTLDFRTSSTVIAPQIIQNSPGGLTLNNPVVLTAPLTVSSPGAGGLGLGGSISGTFGLNVTAGLILLTGSNTFAGPINVNNSTLLYGSSGIPTGGNVTIGAGGVARPFFASNTAATAIGTIILNADGTFAGPAFDHYFINRLQMNGNGATPTLDLHGDEGVLHFVNFGANVNVVGNATWLGGGTSRIVNDTTATMDVNVSNGTLTSSVRLANGINGKGFQFNGNGTVALTNLGNTADLAVANGATVSVTDMAYLGTGSLSVADSAPGTIQYAGDSASSAKPIALGIRGGTISVSKPGANLTLTGVISGSSSAQPLIIRGVPGGSTVTLAANNTYVGPTVIIDGATLSIDSIEDGSALTTPLGTSSNAPANLQIGGGGGILRYTGGPNSNDGATSRGITLDGFYQTAIEVAAPQASLTVNGQITGTGALTKLGPGTLILTNFANNWSGGTVVNAGRLAMGNREVLPKNGDVTVAKNAELNLGGYGSGIGHPIGTLNLNGGTLRSPESESFASVDFYLNKLSTDSNGSTIDFRSYGFFTFFGSGAAISINGNSTWSTPPQSTVISNTNPELHINIGPSVTLSNSIPLTGYPYLITGGGTLYQTAAIGTALTIDHATLRIDDQNVLDATTLTNGTIQYSGPSGIMDRAFVLASDGTFEVSNANTVLTFSSTLTGPGRFIKTGPGTLIIPANTNTVSGGITIDNGAIEVATDDRLGSAAISINPRGILRYMSSTSTSRTFNLNGGTIELPAARTLTFDGASISGGFLRGVGFFRAGGGTSIVGTTALAGIQIDQFGPATLFNFTNSGFLTSSAPLTWNGGSNTGAGHLTVSSTLTTSAFENNGVINIQSGGTWTHTDNFLTSTGGSRITVNPGGTITLLGNELDLNGALLINNGTINGTTSVNFGSLAKGSGIYGAVNVTDGGRFSPGNSPGTVTTGATSWNSGGSYLVEFGAEGTDFWLVNGMLNLNASVQHPFTISLASLDGLIFDNTRDHSWTILHAEAGIAGLDAAALALDSTGFKNDLGSGQFSLNSTASDLFVNFSPVPEPSALATALAALVLTIRQRRRR